MDVISDTIGHHKSLLLINHRFDRQTPFEKKNIFNHILLQAQNLTTLFLLLSRTVLSTFLY